MKKLSLFKVLISSGFLICLLQPFILLIIITIKTFIQSQILLQLIYDNIFSIHDRVELGKHDK